MRKILFGDSHVRPLTHFQSESFKVCSISGATMSGVVNPNSNTNTRKIIKDELSRSFYSEVFFNLGEVDAGFLSLVGSKSIQEAKLKIERSVFRYSDFIKELREEFSLRSVIIINVCPPIIEDDEIQRSKIKMRRDITFSYHERDQVIRHCNAMLDSQFLNVIDAYEEFSKRMKRERFRHINKKDHHFNSKFYLAVMSDLLSNHVNLKKTRLKSLKLTLHDVLSFVK